ncbi:hypothetical protein GCM10025857_23170 [Alicyclobacillus contaminans]|nr:hypothetical protein GCM10025857_23170 [Alicyclobacillus contaminans]
MAFGVSDEPFVLGSARFRACGPDPMYFAVVALTFYLTWILASFIGAIIGSHINTTGLGLELAFPMTFVAILMQILVDIQVISTAAAGAAIAIVIEAVSPGSPYVILIAGIISPLVGCYVRSRQKHVE